MYVNQKLRGLGFRWAATVGLALHAIPGFASLATFLRSLRSLIAVASRCYVSERRVEFARKRSGFFLETVVY